MWWVVVDEQLMSIRAKWEPCFMCDVNITFYELIKNYFNFHCNNFSIYSGYSPSALSG